MHSNVSSSKSKPKSKSAWPSVDGDSGDRSGVVETPRGVKIGVDVVERLRDEDLSGVVEPSRDKDRSGVVDWFGLPMLRCALTIRRVG